jgi:hypothetical protein
VAAEAAGAAAIRTADSRPAATGADLPSLLMNEQVISAPLRRNETPALYTDTGRVLFNRPERVALPDPPRVIALPRLGPGVRRSRPATHHDVGEILSATPLAPDEGSS